MLEAPIPRFRGDCDGCGAPVPSRGPVGWYVRPLDSRYYEGPRQILFCPHCFADLPARLHRRWQRLEPDHAASWLETLAHRLFHGHSPRRGAVG